MCFHGVRNLLRDMSSLRYQRLERCVEAAFKYNPHMHLGKNLEGKVLTVY